MSEKSTPLTDALQDRAENQCAIVAYNMALGHAGRLETVMHQLAQAARRVPSIMHPCVQEIDAALAAYDKLRESQEGETKTL